MVRIIAEAVNINEVFDQDRIRFNTNNHWIDKRPDDYLEVLNRTRTSYWIDAFPKPYTKVVLDLLNPSASWLRDAYKVGIHTGKFPKSFEDERDMLAQRIKIDYPTFKIQNHFIRTDTVSLKNGQHGAGLYNSLERVIESLVTCVSGHSPLEDNGNNELILYLIPWIELNPAREYRGFVCNGRLTAVSQQRLYNVYNYYVSDDDHTFNSGQIKSGDSAIDCLGDVRIIYDYFTNVISKALVTVESYSFDIAVLDNSDQPYFIEANCFGKEYAAGSSLFGWLQDEDILYGRMGEDVIYFRYTKSY